MKKEFIEKVKSLGIYDTANYRYIYRNGTVKRIELDKLDTTAALTDWVVVFDARSN